MMSPSQDRSPQGFTPLRGRADIESFAGPFYERQMEDGVWRLGFRVTRAKLNKMGVCHGGVLAMFADIQGNAVKRRLNITGDTPTVSLGMDFVAPAPEGAWVWSQPEPLRQTGSLIFFQAIVHADDDICMRVNGIYRLKSAPRT